MSSSPGSLLVTTYPRCRYCRYGLLPLSQSDTGLFNAAATSKPRQQEHRTPHRFSWTLKMTKASSKTVCFPHPGGLVGILFPLHLALRSLLLCYEPCPVCNMLLHIRFAMRDRYNFSQPTNPGCLLMSDRERKGMKNKE